MITFPNCKINLGLNIVSKRPDGYHNLETIFYPLKGLNDALELIPSNDSESHLIQSGDVIDCEPEKNLVMKALRLMEKEAGNVNFKQNIHLEKSIPSGAGLGGGSADATFTLLMLNDMFKLNIGETRLIELSKSLGADCPFFVKNKPVYAEGIGEIMTDIECDLSDKHFVVVKPNIHVSTKEAFSGVKPQNPEISVKEIIKRPISDWKDLLKNDFEDSIFPQYPAIQKIKEELYSAGAIYAQMSGSGSAVFGIFDKQTKVSISDKESKIYYV